MYPIAFVIIKAIGVITIKILNTNIRKQIMPSIISLIDWSTVG